MKKISLIVSLFFLMTQISAQTGSAVSMSSAINIFSAFGANQNLGSDNFCTYFLSWDATYLYFGWSGGRTNYSSDMYYIGIDTDPDGSNGNTASIQGATFNSLNSKKLDYYIYYENNETFGGVPATGGNSFELWENSGGSWAFVARTAGDDGTSSQVEFDNAMGTVRGRIAWSLGLGFTPGPTAKIGIVMWANNSAGDTIWSSFPSSNPVGATNQQLTDYLVFSSTGSGVNPNTDGNSSPLPVELTGFSGKFTDGKVSLNWNTATEKNNYGFEVERRNSSSSSNNIQFAKVGFVDGNGNSNSPKSYSFTDEHITSGKYVYRLKQIDTDGKFEYSPEIEVSAENVVNNFVLEQNYPNPFNPSTVIRFGLPYEAKVTMSVYTITGEEVAVIASGFFTAGNHQATFEAADLTGGMYVCRVQAISTDGNHRFNASRKMILLK